MCSWSLARVAARTYEGAQRVTADASGLSGGMA